MTDIERFGIKLSDAELLKAMQDKKTEVSATSKKGIIDQYNLGKLLTPKQMGHIRKDVPTGSIKTVEVTVPVVDKDNQTVTFKKETRYFNKYVKRVDAAIVAGTLSDESVLNANLNAAESTAHFKSIQYDVRMGQAELAAMQAVQADREAKAAAAKLAEKNMHRLSLKQIYENAVATKKLTEKDQQAAVEEGDDAPSHSVTTAVHADAITAQ